MRQPEVEVLLATYNGEQFIREQIESILTQDYSCLRILASDDGSRDETVTILVEYAQQYPSRFRMLAQQERTGSAKANFLRLMKASTAEYACFADQDDVWLPSKVGRSMEAMQRLENQYGKNLPLLVFTDLRVVDEHLKTIHSSMWNLMDVDPKCIHRLERVVNRSLVTGCTSMINRPMLELARTMPEGATMHDRWIGLLAAAMGAAAFLPDQTVFYRQHENNVIGAGTKPSFIASVRRAVNGRGRRAERARSEREAALLLDLYGSRMSERSAAILRAYLQSGRSESAMKRVAMTLRYRFTRGNLLKDLVTLFDLAFAKSDEHPEG